MEVKIEKLVRVIVKEVIAELSKNGVAVNLYSLEKTTSHSAASQKDFCETIDMKNYRSPVLTENHIALLHSDVREIVIPKGTVITPGARDAIAKRRLTVNNSH
jgi:folate-dependent tRNA-U54 methylase TrmFO/GidA